MRTLMWFRRDLRLADNPALVAAAEEGEVVPLFVLDPLLHRTSGPNRRAFLADCLRDLHEATDGTLVLRGGDPVDVVQEVAAEAGAARVYATGDFGPYGHRRDEQVDVTVVDSPYAVAPGRIHRPYAVYSAYERAWRKERVAAPVDAPKVRWASVPSDGLPVRPDDAALGLPPGGERAALDHLDAVDLDAYADRRDVLADDATTRLSPYLRWGCLHPRQVLERLDPRRHEKLRKELVWREFLADVLWRDPGAARTSIRTPPRADHGKRADERFRAWAEGRTGYDLVDAGMRQLLHEGWMHNRARMVAASFLVKDLHLPWERGARHFMHHLVDGDLASNNLNWQWVAGTGIDAAPFHRVFNPTLQADRFDPDGRYVGRWLGDDRTAPPIVDHAEERLEALRRWDQAKA